MSEKRYYITADLDYIQGHLRYGHLEGTVKLSNEELTQLKKDPNFAKELDLETRVDDWEVDDTGDVNSLVVFEVDEDGITQTEVDMKQTKAEEHDNGQRT